MEGRLFDFSRDRKTTQATQTEEQRIDDSTEKVSDHSYITRSTIIPSQLRELRRTGRSHEIPPVLRLGFGRCPESVYRSGLVCDLIPEEAGDRNQNQSPNQQPKRDDETKLSPQSNMNNEQKRSPRKRTHAESIEGEVKIPEMSSESSDSVIVSPREEVGTEDLEMSVEIGCEMAIEL